MDGVLYSPRYRTAHEALPDALKWTLAQRGISWTRSDALVVKYTHEHDDPPGTWRAGVVTEALQYLPTHTRTSALRQTLESSLDHLLVVATRTKDWDAFNAAQIAMGATQNRPGTRHSTRNPCCSPTLFSHDGAG